MSPPSAAAISFARRKGVALDSLPPQLRVWLLTLCDAGDPTCCMVRDWLAGNRRYCSPPAGGRMMEALTDRLTRHLLAVRRHRALMATFHRAQTAGLLTATALRIHAASQSPGG